MNSAAETKSASQADRRSSWIAFLVAGAFFMENLDGTVIATALPQMAKSFGAEAVDLNIGMSAYLLTLGVLIPISGWVADRFGARLVFSTAIIIFTIASLLCGLSNDIGMFVAMRVLQGVGGAMMVPVGRLLVLNNTPKERLIQAVATITWPALIAPILGPPIGGFLTDYASWRWIFYLNLPLGLLALGFALFLLPSAKPESPRPFDWPGFLASGAGLASLMYGLELIGRPVIDWPQVAAFVVGGALLVTFAVFHFRRAKFPMMNLSSFGIRTFAVTIWGGSLFRIAIGSVPFLLPLMLQVGFGLDAFHAGLLTLSVFAGNLSMKLVTTRTLRRFGFKKVLIVNGLFNAALLLACAFFTPDTPMPIMVAVLFVGGLCRSMQFTALNTLAFADIAPPQMTSANTLFSTVGQLTMGMGIAIGAIVIRTGQGIPALDGLPAGEYRLAFVVIAALALFGVLDCLTLKRDAGDNIARKAKA